MAHYQESGKIGWGRYFLWTSVALISLTFISKFYALLLFYIPIRFFHFIPFIIFIILISVINELAAEDSKIRNSKFRNVSFVFVTIFCLLVSWAYFISYVTDISVIDVISNPIYAFGRLIFKTHFLGLFKILTWVIEAALIIYLPIRMTDRRNSLRKPYCESCDKRITNELRKHLKLEKSITKDEFIDIIENKGISALLDFTRTDRKDPNQYELLFSWCGKCEDPYYLTILKHSNIGKKEDSLSIILQLYIIDQPFSWNQLVSVSPTNDSFQKIEPVTDQYIEEIDEPF